MKESLTKIRVENFKNLENFEMSLNQLNVLIGPNGAGKTNVLELIGFVNLCLSTRTPAQPFETWKRYQNAVWSGNDHKPIKLQISYAIDGHNVTYDTAIASSDNKPVILEEKLEIEDYLKMALNTNKVLYHFDPSFARQIRSEDMQLELKNGPHTLVDFKKKMALPHTDSGTSILKAAERFERIYPKQRMAVLQTAMVVDDEMEVYSFPSPIIQKDSKPQSLYKLATDYLVGKNIILLRQLNYRTMRLRTPIRHATKLDEDGNGLINLLFQWFSENQELPENITLGLDALFPNWQISFKVTQDSNIILEVDDGTKKLTPTSIPDGFYKLLAILVAIELEPKVLLVDEIEASLHARGIEYVLDVLKITDVTALITTHSPLVVDYVNIENLILLECTDHKSTCRKIQDPDKLRKELTDRGVTVSDYWLYGEL